MLTVCPNLSWILSHSHHILAVSSICFVTTLLFYPAEVSVRYLRCFSDYNIFLLASILILMSSALAVNWSGTMNSCLLGLYVNLFLVSMWSFSLVMKFCLLYTQHIYINMFIHTQTSTSLQFSDRPSQYTK